ncbi:hypothetical protein V8E53_003987 [Lactarius tabidus]
MPVSDAGHLHKQTHPRLCGRPTDINGDELPEGTPPPPRFDLPPNDWGPFKDAAHFLLADFLFHKVQMSNSHINELLGLWALSAMKHTDDATAPYDLCRTLYATIDAIQDGDAPWKCLSVNTVRDGVIPELLPSWRRQEYEVWYQDPDVVIRNMLDKLDFASHFDTTPYIATDAQGKRRWTDFMTSNFAWRWSDTIFDDNPTTEGVMYCAVILGSDKTTVSVATGNVEYHPLYLSIGNIHNKAQRGHRNGVVPIAFLAIPKGNREFDNDPAFRKFKQQLYHSSISAVLESLHRGMDAPVVCRCPDGHYRRVIYDIGPFIADYPEQVMLSGVVQGWCPRCTSKSSNLDRERGRRTRALTDLLVDTPEFSSAELWDQYGINNDIIPFTNDFPHADIHESLSPDLLHQIIKGSFKDHLVSWIGKYIVRTYGKSRGQEILDDIDKRIAMTPPFPGLRCFKQGWRFKQWTGDDSKALMKVYIPAIADYVHPQVVMCLSAFLDFCYLVRRSEFGRSDLIAIKKALNIFHSTREIFRTSGVRRKGFNLPHQHSMVHYVHLIEEFGAPNGLCSSITESRHITAVKDPWHRSNRYEPLGQMLLTNQRLNKLASARTCFIARGMLPEEQMMAPNPKPVRNNEGGDGAVDGDILGEIALAIRPQPGYPADLQSLAEHLNTPNLPLLASQFLFNQLHPDGPSADEQPLEDLPNIPSQISVFHSAHAIFHAPSDVSGSHGMHRQIIWATPSWRRKEAQYDCVLIVEDQDKPGMRGMSVGRVRAFLSFSYNDTTYPCALIDRFKCIGRGPEHVSGMWKVRPERVGGALPVQSVVHIDTILHNVHLIPVFGEGSIPHRLHYSKSLDIFSSYYVNKYADHHSFEVI